MNGQPIPEFAWEKKPSSSYTSEGYHTPSGSSFFWNFFLFLPASLRTSLTITSRLHIPSNSHESKIHIRYCKVTLNKTSVPSVSDTMNLWNLTSSFKKLLTFTHSCEEQELVTYTRLKAVGQGSFLMSEPAFTEHFLHVLLYMIFWISFSSNN